MSLMGVDFLTALEARSLRQGWFLSRASLFVSSRHHHSMYLSLSKLFFERDTRDIEYLP